VFVAAVSAVLGSSSPALSCRRARRPRAGRVRVDCPGRPGGRRRL